MDVLIYARVSTEAQSGEGQVSIQQQVYDMHALVDRQGWRIFGEFIDSENYIASTPPNKGKVVNPSGERADRPALLELLESVKTGNIDAVICWRDDRLVRHPRVAVTLEDALDQGDSRRNGRGKVQVYDATGATIDRFTLSIKATIWREENKRRVERVNMGKLGTLREGRWPGKFNKLGYQTIREPGRRGRVIRLGRAEDVQTVQEIFNWYEAGVIVEEIRRRLIARGANQYQSIRKYDWGLSIIYHILKSECYTGKATWQCNDGKSHVVDIPAIIPQEQFDRVQVMIRKNTQYSRRNAKDFFLLQGLCECGECGSAVGIVTLRYLYSPSDDGSPMIRRLRDEPGFEYRCYRGNMSHSKVNHPRPAKWNGRKLEWAVWRKIVDEVVLNPENIREQILIRQSELQTQGDRIDSDIAKIRLRLEDLFEERAMYQRMFARKKIIEQEFDIRMDETFERSEFLKNEMARLEELRDNQGKVNATLEYADILLSTIREKLQLIDQSPEELQQLPDEDRRWVMEQRQIIARALVDRAIIYANGKLVLEGVLGGPGQQQLELSIP